jgi:hypothetical protein
MRLLHIQDDGNLSLVEFFEDDTPPYAILSHTWGPDNEEVSYRDTEAGSWQDRILCKAGSLG